MEKKFNSISEEGKALVMEYMATTSGMEVERKEIVAYVKDHISNKEKLSDGVMAGCIKMLTASGELVVVNRARYKKGMKMENLSLKEKVLALFNGFQKDLNKAVTVNVFDLTDSDMEFCRKVNELSNEIESRLWQLEEAGESKEETEAEPVKATVKEEKPKAEPVKATTKGMKADPV